MTVETAFTKLPTLHTNRFILRPIRPMDDQSLFDIYSDVTTMEFYGSEPHTSVEETRKLIEDLRTAYENRKGLNWAVTRIGDDTAIGACSFHQFACKFQRVEVGYLLNRAYWNQGIMGEVMTALLDFAFHDLGVHRVEAIIDDANIGSKKLLLKLGFAYEGLLRERYLLGDQMMDEYFYGLLKRDWLARQVSPSETGQSA